MLAISALDDYSLQLSPTSTGTLTTASGVVMVSTNNATGYTLYLGMDNDETNALVNTYKSEYTIPTLSASTTPADFPNNKWGYSIDTPNSLTNFLPLPTIGNTAILKTTTGPAATSNTDFTVGVKADTGVASGTYKNTVKFTAVTNEAPHPSVTKIFPKYIPVGNSDIHQFKITGANLNMATDIKVGDADCSNINIKSDTELTCEIGQSASIAAETTDFYEAGINPSNPTMQSMTPIIKNNISAPLDRTVDVTTNGFSTTIELTYYQEATLKDLRDNKTYTVAKLGDNNIWMTQNLDLDISATGLTNELTDLNSKSFWDQTYTYGPQDTEMVASSSSIYTDTRSWSLGDVYYDGATSASCGSTATSYADCIGKGFNMTGNPHYHVGNHYQWNTATAGSGADVTTSGTQAPDSICPRGWRLPTSNTGGEFQVLMNTYNITSGTSTSGRFSEAVAAPLYMVRGGNVISGTLRNAAGDGYYWSSTAGTLSDAFELSSYLDKYVFPSDTYFRYKGGPIRCIAVTENNPRPINPDDPGSEGNTTNNINNTYNDVYNSGSSSDGTSTDAADGYVAPQGVVNSATNNSPNWFLIICLSILSLGLIALIIFLIVCLRRQHKNSPTPTASNQ